MNFIEKNSKQNQASWVFLKTIPEKLFEPYGANIYKNDMAWYAQKML